MSVSDIVSAALTAVVVAAVVAVDAERITGVRDAVVDALARTPTRPVYNGVVVVSVCVIDVVPARAVFTDVPVVLRRFATVWVPTPARAALVVPDVADLSDVEPRETVARETVERAVFPELFTDVRDVTPVDVPDTVRVPVVALDDGIARDAARPPPERGLTLVGTTGVLGAVSGSVAEYSSV